MTKEVLIKAVNTEYSKNGTAASVIKNFFESNVCIPKGENRHPYADVLHEWLEDTTLEIQGSYKESNFWKPISDFLQKQYRIKPSEPVYEWQYAYRDYDDNVVISDYLTDDEFDRALKNRTEFQKLEWTKQERK